MMPTMPRIRSEALPPRRRMIRLLAAFALPVVLAMPACAQSSSDPVVAKVNGVEIKASDLAIAEEEIGQNMPPMPPEGKRDYLVRYVSDMILVAKAAEDKK